jgi:predicted flap endonuclease-1-like 5' DNA nuclease
MTYLIMQMLLCLLIAAAIGAILGWLLRSWLGGDSAASKTLIADLQAKLGLADKATADAKAKFADVNGKLGLLEADAGKLRGELGDWKLKFENADKDAQHQRSQFLNLQGSMASAKTDWETKIASLMSDNKQALGFAQTNANNQIASNDTQWRLKLEKAEAATLDMRRQWEIADAEIARLKGLISADQKSDAAVAQRHSDAEAAWNKRRAELEAEIARLKDAASTDAKSDAAIAQRHADAEAAWKRRQGELEADIARLKAAASADAKSDEAMVLRFNNAEADWKSRLAASEKQIGALSDDLGRYRSRISSLEGDLGACGTARASLQSELDRLRAEMAAGPAPSAAPLGFAAAGAAAAAAVTAAPAAPREPDDLKDVVGIGPVLERQLNAAGVMTFRDLARLTPQGVLDLADKLEHVFGDRITRERWVEQAADLHRKKYGTEP